MAQPTQQSTAIAVLKVMFFIACSIGALGLFDLAVSRQLWQVSQALWMLRHLPERQLADLREGPMVLRGTLEASHVRLSPGGEPSVLYYGWIEDHYRSGRSDVVRVLCNVGEDEDLRFRQGDHTIPFEVFHHEEHIALLKRSGLFESLPMERVGIDLGRVHSQKVKLGQLPEGLAERCPTDMSPRGTLYYKEARLPVGQPVVVLGCPKDGVLRSCASESPVPGMLAAQSHARLLSAYAEAPMNWIRGSCVLVAFALGYLCSLLLKSSSSEVST
ncbi:MAG TPA: hypothetical protein PKO07_24435 [Pseudomonadota bacterium]|nr:hypothetical protein [Pseudomonadota bacterium]HNN54202.1 hypothetical protein [Pseudomonadota bacterium]